MDEHAAQPPHLTPARRAVLGEAAAAQAEELMAENVSVVALTFVDTAGIVRVKAVPVERLGQAAALGVGASPCFDAFLQDDSAVPARFTGGAIGDLRLHPVPERLTPLPALPGWAWAPADRYGQDGAPHPVDGRAALRRETDRLAAEGWSVRAAFEVEWTTAPEFAGPAYGMTRLIDAAAYLRDVVQGLAAAGIAADQVHPEYSPSQFEVSVAAEDPVGAADTTILVRQVIRAVSREHGVAASFAPRTGAEVGNGGHVHLSLWRADEGGPVSVMSGGTGPCGLTPEGEAFTAGILARLPALLALGAPSVVSYLRLVPSHWAGAFACWGLENREAALRLITGPAGTGTAADTEAANVEVKCFDATANPYLALAGLLAAGRAGLAAGAVLPAPVTTDPALLDAAERDRLGVAALPASLDEAVAAFEADPVLAEALGEPLADTVAAVRRGESALFAGASPEQIIEAARGRF
ncbi:glutamine synthetase family protein [Actinomadura hibisca]|uniref:glutamine synthetase family protein n=1 Tax=Actinomadura hibisca TaxID=68565 RepID=UPI000A94095A|nr:glutamine synthetase family protein [Actinomadura hibisca]